jgi:TonB family protein
MISSTTKTSVALLALLSVTTCALAQQAPAAATANADQDANAPSERAKRMSENPYKWIMIMDDKPRPKKDEPREPRRAPAAAPAAAPATAAPVPAAAAAAPPTPRSFEPRVPANQTASQPAAPAAIPTAATVANPPIPTVVAPEPAPALAAAAQALRDAEAEEEPLRPLKQVQPEMTRQIAASGITQGRVRAKFTVAPDGSVTKPEIVNSSNRALNGSVLAALNQWKYAPIKEPRDAQVEFAFDFSR